MKKWIIAIGTLILIPIILFILGKYLLEKDDPDFIANLIQSQPNKISIIMSENNEVTFKLEEDRAMPLASVFKIMVAIELINQYKDGNIDLYAKIPLKEVEKYNLIEHENSNHSVWKKEIVKNRKNISLYEIAKGMLIYSSNPNTDYLINKLGIENINIAVKKLTNFHTNIYPISASILVPHYLKNVQHIKESKLDDVLNNMDTIEYENLVLNINQLLKNGEYPEVDSYYLTESQQKNWSNRTPKSTTKDYINLLNNLNNIYSEKRYNQLLKDLIKINQNKLFYMGGKNGETINIINRTLTIENGKDIKSIVVFIKDLDYYEQIKVKNNIDSFIKKALKEEYVFNEY